MTRYSPQQSNSYTWFDAFMIAVCLSIYAALFFLSIKYAVVPALGQERHAQHHNVYQDWVNKNGHGCCNDKDCGELADANERTVSGQLQVRIEGEWCQVQFWHYLRKGNAPNWQSAHVCVRNQTQQPTGPCERLLCYQPRPLF